MYAHKYKCPLQICNIHDFTARIIAEEWRVDAQRRGFSAGIFDSSNLRVYCARSTGCSLHSPLKSFRFTCNEKSAEEATGPDEWPSPSRDIWNRVGRDPCGWGPPEVPHRLPPPKDSQPSLVPPTFFPAVAYSSS